MKKNVFDKQINSNDIITMTNELLDKLVRSEPIPVQEESSQLESEKNPILSASNKLLIQLPKFRNLTIKKKNNFLEIQKQLISDINTFTTAIQKADYNESFCYVYRYLLCCVLDESILLSKWAQKVNWRQHSLLNHFYNETQGGEKFFSILDTLLQLPEQNICALEFIYVCISLGFKGKYYLLDNGGKKLETLRKRLFTTIRHLQNYQTERLSTSYTTPKIKIKRRFKWHLFLLISAILPLCFYLVYYMLLLYEKSHLIYKLDAMTSYLR